MWRLFIFTCFTFFSFNFPIAAQDAACPADYAGYLPPRLIVGEQARILPDIELNLRATPSTELARIGTVRGFQHVTVLDEPRCAEGFIWWHIGFDNDETNAWVVEGNRASEEYYLEPRGELIWKEGIDGELDPFIRTASGVIEPRGCLRPPDDYELVTLGYATFNKRTLFMLDNAQIIYEESGHLRVNFRQLITQGSYNAGGVAASFGTHDGGGAVDIAVRDASQDYEVMSEEILPMLEALRIAGFAAWVRETGELYPNSPIHIHAIAIGDAEASEIAQQQVDSEFGYFSGFNGLPPEEGQEAFPDRYGDPIFCEWMLEMGFADRRES